MSSDLLNSISKALETPELIRIAGWILLLQIARWVFSPVRKWFSPLRHLQGPPNESFLFGHMKYIFAASGDHRKRQAQWIETYGATFQYRGILSAYRLFTTDTRALTHVMTHTDTFPKPDHVRKGLANVVGDGLISAEGDVHKRERRIMSPSFGLAQIRELVPIFWDKSNKLRDIWLETLKGSTDGVINVLPWLSRATLDIIGAAGFDHHFNSLENPNEDELSAAFKQIFQANESPGILAMLQTFFPVLNYIPTQRKKEIANSLATMKQIGTRLIANKKAALDQDQKTGSASQGRDLLTLLIKSNIQSENEVHRMSDEEVLSQISTFLVAGHETTSTATTWALYAIAKHPHVQRRLRKELLESGLGDEPGMAELEKLTYLDHFVRECLRVHSPVPTAVRVAAHNTQIPVSKTYKDKYGAEHNHVSVQKGDNIAIPILALNNLEEIWGEDAEEFKPERWDNLPEAVKEMPGVWGHLMTFIHGQRSCIGFRFSIVEMKALLYSLVKSIEFDIDPAITIGVSASAVTRPYVVSERKKGNQMPLICKPVSVA